MIRRGDSPEYEGYINHGYALARQHRYDDALAEIDRAIALDNGNSRAYNDKARILKQQGKLDEALDVSLQATYKIPSQPNNGDKWSLSKYSPIYCQNSGILYEIAAKLYEEGKYAEAINKYSEAIYADSRYYDLEGCVVGHNYVLNRDLKYAWALNRVGEYDKASREIDRITTKIIAQDRRPQVDLTAEANHIREYARHVQDGDRLYVARSYDLALIEYNATQALDPKNVFCYINLSNTYNQLRRYTEADTILQQAQIHHPTDAQKATIADIRSHVLNEEAHKYYNAGNYDPALVLFEKAVQANPTKAAGYLCKAAALNALGRYSDALVAIEEIYQHNPDLEIRRRANGLKIIVEGSEFFNVSNYAAALVKFEEAIAIDTTEAIKAIAHIASAKTLNATKHYDDAVRVADIAAHLTHNPAEIQSINEIKFIALFAQGLRFFDTANYPRALEKFNDAIAIDRTKVVAYIKKAETLNKLDRVDEALVAADEALHHDPAAVVDEIKATAYNGKGELEFGNRRYQEALNLYDQSTRLVSNNVRYHLNKAKAQNTLTDPDYEGAITSIGQAQALGKNPTAAEAQEAKAIHAAALNGQGDKLKAQGSRYYEEAKGKYREALDRDNQQLYRQNLEDITRKTKNIADGEKLFTKAQDSFDNGNGEKASYEVALKNISQAMGLNRAIGLNDHPDYNALEAKIVTELNAIGFFEEGQRSLQEYKYPEALSLFKRAYATSEEIAPKAKYNTYWTSTQTIIDILGKGDQAFSKGQYDKALKFYTDSKAYEAESEFFEEKANILIGKKSYLGAILFASKALEISKDSDVAQRIVFEAYQELIKGAIEQGGDSSINKKYLPEATKMLGDDTYYVEQLKDLINNPGGRYEEALKLLQDGADGQWLQEEKFKEYLKTIPKHRPDLRIKAHNTYGMKLFDKERYTDASKEYEEVLKCCEPQEQGTTVAGNELKVVEGITKAMVLSNLGWVSMELGIEHMKVIKHFTEALKLNKELEEANVGISIAYNRHGETLLEKNPRDALDAFTKAFGYHKDDIYQANLGLAYMGLKAYGQALDCFKGIKEGSFEYERVFLKKEEAEEAKAFEQEKLKADHLAEQEEKFLASITTKKTQGKPKEDVNKLYDDLIELTAGTKKSLEYVTKKVKHTDDGQSLYMLVESIRTALHLNPHYMPALGAIAKCYPDSPELAGVDADAASAAYDSLI